MLPYEMRKKTTFAQNHLAKEKKRRASAKLNEEKVCVWAYTLVRTSCACKYTHTRTHTYIHT